MAATSRPQESSILSSSPAFATPIHPLPNNLQRVPPPPPVFKPAVSTILPILLPAPTLRPLAFRTFTKKYNLTLNSSALLSLAAFIGKHCGSGWREEGTGEKVLDEVAKIWKAENGPVIVEDGNTLKTILKTLEGCMVGGRVGPAKSGTGLSRHSSFAFGNDSAVDLSDPSRRPTLDRSGSSFGLSSLTVDSHEDDDDPEESSKDPRSWLKAVSAFDQPRFAYDPDKKHYLSVSTKPTMFPSAAHKTAVFKQRYNVIHQRLLRNPAFQAPSFSAEKPAALKRSRSSMTDRQFFKLTPIANLLGRGGTQHLLLGMLVIAPTGTLALNDLSGSISLDLQHATSMSHGEVEPYFCPGMIVLVDGTYEEDWAGAGSSGLGDTGGVGGTIGGRFLGFEIGGPPVEKREVSLGINLSSGDFGGGFGWTDFLGLGSERAVGGRMKRLEKRLIGSESEATHAQRQVVMLAQVTLDQPSTLSALRHVLQQYAAADSPPLAFVLTGDFSSKAAMAGSGTGSIEYKELFNELASVLADYPSLLRSSTWVFVPGDNDPWASSFSAGASTLIPREGIPDIFTSRIKCAFAAAKSEGPPLKKDAVEGEAMWTSNPTRLSLFGSAHEIVVFRDDVSSRLRRNAIHIGQAARQAADAEGNLAVATDNAATQQLSEDVAMTDAVSTTEGLETQGLSNPPLADSSSDFCLQQAKRLILSLLPQSTLSPFSSTVRPIHWDFASSSLCLYPMPHTLLVADAESPPFALTYEGCHVINTGRLVEGSGGRKRKKVQWVEYDCWAKRGLVREGWLG